MPTDYPREDRSGILAEEQGGPSVDMIPSPGGWVAPAGCRPGWDWVPPSGVYVRPDSLGRWMRAWYRTPFVDRYAHAWMWHHGCFDVSPPSGPEAAGVREPSRQAPNAGTEKVLLHRRPGPS